MILEKVFLEDNYGSCGAFKEDLPAVSREKGI